MFFCSNVVSVKLPQNYSPEEKREAIKKMLLDKGIQILGFKEGRSTPLAVVQCQKCPTIFSRDYNVILNSGRAWCRPCANKYDVSQNRTGVYQEKDVNEFVKKHNLKNPVLENKVLTYECEKCSSKISYSFAYINRQSGGINLCAGCRGSRGQSELSSFISSYTPIVSGERTLLKRFNGKTLEIDVYAPSVNIGFEFNGDWWHSENCLGLAARNKHQEKWLVAKENKVRLIQIFEKEWNTKREIIQSIIKNSLGVYDKTIFGRKCTVKTLSNNDVKNFLNENHIQGHITSQKIYGLFYKEELVSVASFSKSRFSKDVQWECTRFANVINTKIHGSFSKLLKAFEDEVKPTSLVSYSDNRYFTGAMYEKCGFTLEKVSGPNYFYFKGDGAFESRQKFQKHKLPTLLEDFDPSLSEWGNMQKNNWNRIFYAGNSVWVKRY